MTAISHPAGPKASNHPASQAREVPNRNSGLAPLQRERIGLAIGLAVLAIHAAATIREPLWLDEAYTLGAVNHLGDSLQSTHGTMAAYYLVEWTWGLVSTAGWWLRLPSVAFAVGTLCLVRLIARRIGGSNLAAVAVPLLALHPVFEWKAVEARSYSMVTFLISLAWWLSLQEITPVDGQSQRRWRLLVAVGIVGSLAHGLFPIHLVPILLTAALGPRPAVSLRRLGPAVAASALTAAALWSMGAATVGTHTTGGPIDWVNAAMHEMLPGSLALRLGLFLTAGAGVVLSAVRVRVTSDPGRRAVFSVPVVWLVGPTAALTALGLVVPRFNPRYLAPSVPGVALCLGVAVCFAASRLAPKRPLVGISMAGALVAGLLALSLLTADRAEVEDWDAVAQAVADHVQPGDAIFFITLFDGERPPFEAAWRDVNVDSSLTVINSDRPLGKVRRYERYSRTPAQIEQAAAEHDRVWVINAHFYGKENSTSMLDSPWLSSLDVVYDQTVDGGIQVTLYERAG